MALDTSIYNALMRPPKSAMEYQNEFEQADLAREDAQQKRVMNALALDQHRAQFQDQQRVRDEYGGIRNALAMLPPGASQTDQISAVRRLGTQTALTQADALEKGYVERRKTEATVGETDAKTATTQYDLQRKKFEHGIQTLTGAATPETARAALVSGQQSGLLDPTATEAALKEIPNDPQQYQQWRMSKLQGLLGAKDQFELQTKQRDFGLKAANEIMTPDGKGGYAVNQPLVDAKGKIAKAGKTDVNLAVNTEKTLTSTMAEGLAKQLDGSLSDATAAVGQIQNAKNLRQLLNSGKVITGPGADTRIMLTQLGVALGVTGKDSEEQLANTRAAIQTLAQSELTAAASMKGQGAITDAERAMLKKAAAGDINMSASELRAMALAIERSAQTRISAHQAQVERLKDIPGAAPMIPFYSVPGASPAAGPAQAPAPAQGASAATMNKITMSTESGGRRYGPDGGLLTSPKGAQGEMQVMPNTNRDPGYGVAPARDNSPEELARVGRDYLGAMMRKYGNDPAKAWAAYNAGPGALDAALKTGGDGWLSKLPAETQAYVRKNMQQLQGAQAAPAPATPRPAAAPAQPPARVAAAPAGQRPASPQRAPSISNW